MTLSPKERAFVLDPCGGGPEKPGAAFPPGFKPELRRTLMKIKQIFDDLYGGSDPGVLFSLFDTGEAWFPYGSSGDTQQGHFRHYVLEDNGGVGRSGSAPTQGWDFDGAADYYKADTAHTTWTLGFLEDWSLNITFDADRYNHTSREVIVSIDDANAKPFQLMLEASGAGDNAGKLVAMATDSGGTERDLAWSGTVVNDTDYFVTVVHDASESLLKMSVNGEVYETLDVSAYTFASPSTSPYVCIGSHNGASFFDGEICLNGQPFVYYPRFAMTQSQSDWLYNNGTARKLEGMMPFPDVATLLGSMTSSELLAFLQQLGSADQLTILTAWLQSITGYSSSSKQVLYNNGGSISWRYETSIGCCNCFYDEFTDTNGTDLDAHTPDRGGTWSNVSAAADWEIESNKAEQKATTQGGSRAAPANPILYKANADAGCNTPNQVEADITFDFSGISVAYEIKGGVCCRFSDASNYFYGGYAQDNSGIAYIQIIEEAAGTMTVRASSSLGALNLDGNTYHVTLQNNSGDVTLITDDGTLTYSSSTNASVADCGLYAEVNQNGLTAGAASVVMADNFIISEL